MEKEQYYLATSNWNWADEMNLEGFCLISHTEKVSLENTLNKYEDSITIYVGSNEEVEFDNGADVLEHITFTKITEEQAKHISIAFGAAEFTELELIENYLWEQLPEGSSEDVEDALSDRIDALEEGSEEFKSLLGLAIEYDDAQGNDYSASMGFDLVSKVYDRILDEEENNDDYD